MTEEAEADFQSLLDSEQSAPAPERGQELTGKVAALDAQGMYIDLGLKREGLVPRAELDKLQSEQQEFQVGQEVSVVVTQPEDQDGNLIVSIRQRRQQGDWDLAHKLMDSGEVWEGVVSGHNRGGLLVKFGGLQAFVPASQIADLPRNMAEDDRARRLTSLVGRRMGFKVVEVNMARRRLVLSQRQAQHEYREIQRAHLLETLAEGQVCKGVVTALRDFGAFVDLGGADGLVHISEIAWQRVSHPSEVLKVGQEVEVEVIKIDRDSKRIGLSLKRRQATPWSRVRDLFRQGQAVDGSVTRIAAFGAFVDLGQGIEGLLHISRWGGATLTEGQAVTVKILNIEPERQRVSLALAQAGGQSQSQARPAADMYEDEDDDFV